MLIHVDYNRELLHTVDFHRSTETNFRTDLGKMGPSRTPNPHILLVPQGMQSPPSAVRDVSHGNPGLYPQPSGARRKGI